MQFGLIVANQNKKNKNQDTIHFEIAIYAVLHKRNNITASFAEQVKFQDKKDFYSTFREIVANQSQKN